MGEGGGHAPQRSRAHPVSGRGLLLGSFTIHNDLVRHPGARYA